jgi:hypothetical protein
MRPVVAVRYPPLGAEWRARHNVAAKPHMRWQAAHLRHDSRVSASHHL